MEPIGTTQEPSAGVVNIVFNAPWNQVEPRVEPSRIATRLERNPLLSPPHRLLFILLNKSRGDQRKG